MINNRTRLVTTPLIMATELWQQLPTHIKDLSTYNFPKTLKEYLLAEQLTHWNYFCFNHIVMYYDDCFLFFFFAI